MDVLGEVVKLTVLDLPTVSPVSNVISRRTAVVEVLILVNPGVIVVSETWAVFVKVQTTIFLRDGNVLDPATPTPLSLPAMWLKMTSTKERNLIGFCHIQRGGTVLM